MVASYDTGRIFDPGLSMVLLPDTDNRTSNIHRVACQNHTSRVLG